MRIKLSRLVATYSSHYLALLGLLRVMEHADLPARAYWEEDDFGYHPVLETDANALAVEQAILQAVDTLPELEAALTGAESFGGVVKRNPAKESKLSAKKVLPKKIIHSRSFASALDHLRSQPSGGREQARAMASLWCEADRPSTWSTPKAGDKKSGKEGIYPGLATSPRNMLIRQSTPETKLLLVKDWLKEQAALTSGSLLPRLLDGNYRMVEEDSKYKGAECWLGYEALPAHGCEGYVYQPLIELLALIGDSQLVVYRHKQGAAQLGSASNVFQAPIWVRPPRSLHGVISLLGRWVSADETTRQSLGIAHVMEYQRQRIGKYTSVWTTGTPV